MTHEDVVIALIEGVERERMLAVERERRRQDRERRKLAKARRIAREARRIEREAERRAYYAEQARLREEENLRMRTAIEARPIPHWATGHWLLQEEQRERYRMFDQMASRGLWHLARAAGVEWSALARAAYRQHTDTLADWARSGDIFRMLRKLRAEL